MAVIKNYQKDNLTVRWEPAKCMHSEKCWRGLPSVFNPKSKPWFNADGAEASAIRKQVESCPSGALSVANTTEIKTNNPMKVTLAQNGPILIQDEITICDHQGNEEVKKGPIALCRCGASSNKPFCDGTHKKTDFEG